MTTDTIEVHDALPSELPCHPRYIDHDWEDCTISGEPYRTWFCARCGQTWVTTLAR